MPAPGEVASVVPGLQWARLPLPFRLNHVNVWFLDDTSGFAVVDAGVDTPDMRGLWQAMHRGPLGERRLTRLIATHGHTDHVGLAGYLCQTHDMPIEATLTEWLWARLRSADAQIDEPRPHIARFLRMHGCDERLVSLFGSLRGGMAAMLGPPPKALTRIRAGDSLAIGGRQWRVIIGEGHSEEHASFHCDEAGVLIAGDQILSHISPVVGVFAGEPDGDPLADYLRTLEPFLDLPPDTLVLPSHGLPFHGLHARVRWLIDHHAERLDRFEALFTRPLTAVEAAFHVFSAAMAEAMGVLAVAETLAHLHRLVGQGRLQRLEEPDGTIRFARVP